MINAFKISACSNDNKFYIADLGEEGSEQLNIIF